VGFRGKYSQDCRDIDALVNKLRQEAQNKSALKRNTGFEMERYLF